MDPMTAMAVAAPVLSVAGTYLQNQESRRAAEQQQNFQKEMSDTAHQREVKDLRAANLNPILSALGSGASTPNGAQPTINNLGEALNTGASTGLGIRMLKSDTELKEAQTDNLHDNSKKQAQESLLTGLQAREQVEKNKQSVMQTELLKKTIPSMIKEAKARGDWSQVNQLMGVIKAGSSSAKDAAELINPFKVNIKTGK